MLAKNRLPKVILKTIYENFKVDAQQVSEQIKSIPGLKFEDGMALANLAKVCKDFGDFATIVQSDLNPGSVQLSETQMGLLAGGFSGAGNGAIAAARYTVAANSYSAVHELNVQNVNAAKRANAEAAAVQTGTRIAPKAGH